MNVAAPAPACLAVDTSARLLGLRDVLDELARRGYAGIGRTVPVLGYPADSEVTSGELAFLLEHPAGFGSWWYQRPRYPGWKPRRCNPEADARFACACARAAGYAPGTHGFVDAEGMHADTTAAEAHDYNGRWSHVTREEGFTSEGAGLYDGYSEPETPEELYEIADVNCYWSDAANRRIATRGTAIVQRAELVILGIRFDPDELRPDRLGGVLRWTVAAAGDVA